jgi:hypothetical protein
VWVLGTLAKRWTAVLQPEGFDSPILRTIRPTRSEIEVDPAVCVLTRVWAWHSLEVLGKRVRYSGARVRWKPRFMRGFCFLWELTDGSVRRHTICDEYGCRAWLNRKARAASPIIATAECASSIVGLPRCGWVLILLGFASTHGIAVLASLPLIRHHRRSS